MQTILLVIYLLIVVALVFIILLQRSESSGFSSSNSNNFMTARGSKNALTRLTAILAFCFFVIALALVIIDKKANSVSDIFDHMPAETPSTKPLKDEANKASVVPAPPISKNNKTESDKTKNSPSLLKKQELKHEKLEPIEHKKIKKEEVNKNKTSTGKFTHKEIKEEKSIH